MRKLCGLFVGLVSLVMACSVVGYADCGFGYGDGYGASHCGGFAFKLPLFLITLAIGWWVLKTAKTENKLTTLAGNLIGWAIILASIASIMCLAAVKLCYRFCPPRDYQGARTGLFCPMQPKTAAPAAQEPTQQEPANPHQPGQK